MSRSPNNALQRTRVRPAGGRSPLSFQTLGARRNALRAGLILYALAASARADIGTDPPSFEQQFALSKIVAIARVEAGVTGSHSSQIYRARVTYAFKGTENGQVIYFWGGNVGGSNAHGIGQVYLVMLRNGGRPVSDAVASFAPSGEPLYEAICLSNPILLWRSEANPPPRPFPAGESVFLFGCPEPASAHTVGQGAILFHSWMGYDEMIEYLKKLAVAGQAKPRAGA